eukprot:CAMPEP_0114583182 /NCGR_PEP_ID=MMETSP0125-20121206/6984_1 /TAXON_ID=485358 ORGANISM="Aristerostoma sp., Strain ATCC 50986" /NCGR_SAMPLE_ID=MMETSP0125 /ASSEMBLY_ACC=CAM_ASM_000245 /LENGTH=84 /DNA_ID=CAMNT_0001776521 /DNA_START=991 /DNA_END=1245 /DNA_ORIENTATION=+
MPEMKKRSNNVTKHVSLVNEISGMITERGLTESSRLEQEICAKESKNEDLKGVMEVLEKPLDKFDKLKLSIIYALRYESDAKGI